MFCSNCGKDIKAGEKFCPECGYNLQNNKSIVLKIDKKKSKTILIYFGITALILTIGLCVYNLLSPINYDIGFASIKASYNPFLCKIKGKISFLGMSQDVERNDVSIIEYIGLKKELKKTDKTNIEDIFGNYTKSNENTSGNDNTNSINKPIKPSEYHFGTSYERAIQDKTKPMIIMFYADWCQYSQRFMPIYEEMYKNEKNYYNFVKINVEDSKYSDIIEEYNIVSFPAVFLVNTKTDEREQLENKDFGDIDLLFNTMVRFATRCGYYM